MKFRTFLLLWLAAASSYHVAAEVRDTSPFVVEETFTHDLHGRAITMERVANPGLPDPPSRVRAEDADAERAMEALTRSPEWRDAVARHRGATLTFVSALVVADGASFIRWFHEGEEFQAWSNVDFHHLIGLTAIEKDGRRHSMILAVSDLRPHAQRSLLWPGVPPEFGVDYPAFLLVKGDPGHAEGLEPMIGLHDHYEENLQEILVAHERRVRVFADREAAREDAASRPQETVIRFWPRNGSRYLDADAKAEEGAR